MFAFLDGALSPIGLTEVMWYSHVGIGVLRKVSALETGLAEGSIEGFASSQCVSLPA